MSVFANPRTANPRTADCDREPRAGTPEISGSLLALSYGQFSRNPNWMMRLEFSTTLVVR